MNWGPIISVFSFSTFKFMFAPFLGASLDLFYLETFLVCAIGGSFSAAVFYFSAELLLKRAARKRHEKHELAKKTGIHLKEKKNFTKLNKFIVILKHKLGIYGISFWAPFFLSVPIGSIITAKFYGKLKKTFPLIVIGMFLNSFIVTTIAYLFK